MSDFSLITQSKLTPPRLPESLRRERLAPVVEEIRSSRLTLIVAGAGYGKTTFAVQALRRINANRAWYRLDTTDRDFHTFVRRLAIAFKSCWPRFGDNLLRLMDAPESMNRAHETTLKGLVEELKPYADQELFITLDDYHDVHDCPDIREAVSFLLTYIPPSMRLIILSRNNPQLPVARLRALRQVTDVTENHLAFSAPEVAELYQRVLGLPMAEEQLTALREKTGGWVTALILFYQSLKRETAARFNELLNKFQGSSPYLADYLEENVLVSLPGDLQDFLLKTSILSSMDIRFCDRLLDIGASRRFLTLLEKERLFTFVSDSDDRAFYYHPLFREFLLNKFSHSFDKRTRRAIHERAAGLFEEREEYAPALHHYLEGACFDRARDLLGAVGLKLFLTGQIVAVSSCIDRLPERYADGDPRILYLRAILAQVSGNPDQAIRGYRKALSVLQREPDAAMEGRVRKELGLSYYFTGDLSKAEEVLSGLLPQVTNNPFMSIEIRGLLILINSILGELASADEYARQAVSDLPRISGPEAHWALAWIRLNHSVRYIQAGAFDTALKMSEEALVEAKASSFHTLLPLTYFHFSWMKYFRGDFAEGLKDAQTGLEALRTWGIQDSQYAWLLYATALNLAGLNELWPAIDSARESLKVFERVGNRWGQGMARRALHHFYLKSGNPEDVRDSLEAGLSTIKGLRLPLLEGGLKADKAASLLGHGSLKNASDLLNEAETLAHSSPYELSRLYCLKARYYHLKDEDEKAVLFLRKSLDICRRKGYTRWLEDERSWVTPLLSFLLSREGFKDQAYLDGLMRRLHKGGDEPQNRLETQKEAGGSLLTRGASDAPPLHVRLLGAFALSQSGREVGPERWKGEIPRRLFKYLAFARSRGFVPREALMEYLWPDQDPNTTGKRLNVALSSLRRALEPTLRKGVSSAYILKQNDAYKLHLGAGGTIDLELFGSALKRAEHEQDPEKQRQFYLQAEALYHGDLLAEDLYEEWLLDERERVKAMYLRILKELIQYFYKLEDFPACIAYAEKYLDRDDCAEQIYRFLMSAYAKSGAVSMVARTYERCVKAMRDQTGYPVHKQTERLYRELMAPYAAR